MSFHSVCCCTGTAKNRPQPQLLQPSLNAAAPNEQFLSKSFWLGFVRTRVPEPQLNVSRIHCYSSRFGPSPVLQLRSSALSFVNVPDPSKRAEGRECDRGDAEQLQAGGRQPASELQPSVMHEDLGTLQQECSAPQDTDEVRQQQSQHQALNAAVPEQHTTDSAAEQAQPNKEAGSPIAQDVHTAADRFTLILTHYYTMDSSTGKVTSLADFTFVIGCCQAQNRAGSVQGFMVPSGPPELTTNGHPSTS